MVKKKGGGTLEWKAVKNLLLVLLILLNAVLGFFNYQQYQQNILTSSQEKAIYEVLSQNHIILYTDLLTKFSPMRKIALRAPSYSRDDIKQQFFAGEDTTVTVEFDKTIIKSQDKILTMQENKGTIVFTNGTRQSKKTTLEEAKKEAVTFVNALQKSTEKFEIGNIRQTEDGYEFIFFQKYKGMWIFSNYYKVHTGQSGISSVELTYFEVEGFTGEKKDICFSDEALLTFLMEIEKEREQTGNYETITVQKMELGYDFQEMEELTADNVAKLVPCYYIYVLGKQQPYRINAYTNEMIKPIKVQNDDVL